ncbi:MAG: FixH family protein [Rhodospirillaceae bacterium]|nr:FixH family protein [Rhodospirillaceae bacterium]MBT7265528.1 FixH family protein [Rhodospirillaceae bacterium]
MAFYNDKNPVTGRSVLWWVISFFMVIFIANFFFIYFALTTWTGLSTENAYEKGVRYNETLDQGAQQKKLGWQSRVVLTKTGQLRISMLDRAGQPLTGLAVKANLIRPVIEGSDQQITLRETTPGIYQAAVRLSHLGRWRVEVVIGEQYRLRHDIELK